MNNTYIQLYNNLKESTFFDTQYDNELLKIAHYRTHPEMLPFVGKNYSERKRILLVGESHYLDGEKERYEESKEVITNWYNEDYSSTKINPNNIFIQKMDYYYTRSIINWFISGGNSPSYYIYLAPIKAWWGNKDRTNFQSFSFMNYYQRPAYLRGETIDNTQIDDIVAYNTLNEVTDILKPDCIIFLSKKAYNAYSNLAPEKSSIKDIRFVCHPMCHWWHRNNGIYGKEKFKSIISEVWQ